MSLKQRLPFLRWSFWRLAIGARNITKTGQIGDGREAAAADYVVANARQGDIDDVIAIEHKTHGEYQRLVPDVVLESEFVG
jgi:catechol O-methyltransferase